MKCLECHVQSPLPLEQRASNEASGQEGASPGPVQNSIVAKPPWQLLSVSGSQSGSTGAWQPRDGLCKATCELVLEGTLRMRERGKERVGRKTL